jgi:hypothetical protein
MSDTYTTEPEIRRVLVLSTAHAKRSTIHEFVGWPLMFNHTYGSYFCIPSDDEWLDDIPEDLRAVLVYARNLGCDEVNFDCDGAYVAGLPTYEW